MQTATREPCSLCLLAADMPSWRKALVLHWMNWAKQTPARTGNLLPSGECQFSNPTPLSNPQQPQMDHPVSPVLLASPRVMGDSSRSPLSGVPSCCWKWLGGHLGNSRAAWSFFLWALIILLRFTRSLWWSQQRSGDGPAELQPSSPARAGPGLDPGSFLPCRAALLERYSRWTSRKQREHWVNTGPCLCLPRQHTQQLYFYQKLENMAWKAGSPLGIWGLLFIE